MVTRKTGARSQLLEHCVHSLTLVGFQVYDSQAHFRAAEVSTTRYVIRNYPHESLYGTPGRKEGFISADGQQFILEAKYQDSSGSVDEKLPYLWMSFLASPVPNWIAVLDGNYWAKNNRAQDAVHWLRQLQPPDGRQFHIFTRRTFFDWAKSQWSTGVVILDGRQHRRAEHQAERAARERHANAEQSLWGD